jgi:hypothetical protein
MEETKKVYGIFEKKTGDLVYIGKTRSSLEQRWFYHTWRENWSRSPIRRYMESKGFDEFEMIQLRICVSEQELDDWEKHLIIELEPKCNVRLWT